MTRINFVRQDGEPLAQADAEPEGGETLLDVGQRLGMPLEGTCEGQMACSTCHVTVGADWFDELPPASEAEEDMLDFAAGACRTSRLACQIRIADCPDGLTVKIPSESRDMRGA